ncbi:oligosaccharide flippase family protein [Eubacterium limosum]|uniref:oligosaccharide flippase family protein n=1 Tax=Eubacterium limosum TaxID=1736 RepID=UPI0010643373|nr:oligosaccharide flippase family protein [Eubacterium limosum]
MRKKILVLQKKLFSSGFYNIFFSSVLNKIVNFAYGIALVRVISKSDYGVYSYANNIYSYFALLLGLGISSALLQICSEDGDDLKRKTIHFKFCFSFSIYTNFLLSMAIIIFAIGVPLSISGSNKLLIIMGLFPVFTQFTPLYSNWLRSNFKNEEYAYLNVFNTLAISVLSIFGAFLYGSIGLIIGRYLAALITVWFSIFILKCPFPHVLGPKGLFRQNDFKYIVSIGMTLCITEAVIQIIALIGVSILGIYVPNNETIAAYKTATVLPTALAFISNAVLIYVYPYFAKNNKDYKWTRKYYIYTLIGITIISFIITFICIGLSRPIIILLFSEQYLDSIKPFSILMISFLCNSVLRIPANNLIITQRKLKFNFIVSIIGALITIVLNVILIPKFLSDGAAYAQLFSTFGIGIVCTCYYLWIIWRNK